jgi:hypothetical protein
LYPAERRVVTVPLVDVDGCRNQDILKKVLVISFKINYATVISIHILSIKLATSNEFLLNTNAFPIYKAGGVPIGN